ncbi:hypothetical protein MPER_10559, partial [Moniliophthora perniciosa FA553]
EGTNALGISHFVKLPTVRGPCTSGPIPSSKANPFLTPNIFWKVFENQFEKLLIEPCSRVDTTKWDGLPNVIAIDGLDECIDHASQERLLRLIRKLVHTRGYPIPWTFLIFSRPELQIQDAFSHKDFSLILECFAIRPSKEVNRDIRRCLVDRFAELRGKLRALRHEDESWPGEDATEQLVKRADGQFIFVNTVIKYIDTPYHVNLSGKMGEGSASSPFTGDSLPR